MKKLAFLFSVIVLSMSCKKENVKVVKKTTELKTKVEKIDKHDTIYKDKNMIVIKRRKSIDTLFLFHSELDNKKFKVEIKNIELKKELDFSNYEYKKMFITVTKDGVKEDGVNFAGSFCFVSWGCGSPCQVSAVVDMKTGIVYNGLPSAVGYKFEKDSKILIVNPPDSTNYYPKNRWVPYPEQYIWTGKRFIQIKKINH